MSRIIRRENSVTKLLGKALLIMPPNFEDVVGHIGFGLCVHPSVRPWIHSSHFLMHAISYEQVRARVLKFHHVHIWILYEKWLTRICFLVRVISLS